MCRVMCDRSTKYGHHYLIGICLECGRHQDVIETKVVYKEKKKKNLNERQQLAEEIYLWSGKQLPFGMLMAMINRTGMQWVRQCWREVVVDGAKNPLATFKWKVAQVKMRE